MTKENPKPDDSHKRVHYILDHYRLRDEQLRAEILYKNAKLQAMELSLSARADDICEYVDEYLWILAALEDKESLEAVADDALKKLASLG